MKTWAANAAGVSARELVDLTIIELTVLEQSDDRARGCSLSGSMLRVL